MPSLQFVKKLAHPRPQGPGDEDEIGSGFFSISSEISVNLSKIPTLGPHRKKCQSKSRPMGPPDSSNPHPLPDPPPPPLGVNIDRCINIDKKESKVICMLEFEIILLQTQSLSIKPLN